MKKIIYMLCVALSAVCVIASAATTVPVQLINPTGSSAGQAIVSTGSSSAPAWGAVNAATISGAIQYDALVGTGAGAVGSISPGTAGGIFASNGTSAYPSFQTPASLGLTTVTKLRYFNTSAQSIPNITSTTVTGWTKDFDNNNDFNASTGTFTAPVTGFYLVSAQISFSYTTAATNNFQLSELQSAGNSLTWTCAIPTGATNPTCAGNTIVSLAAGNTVNIKIYQNSGSAQTLSVSTYINTISIARIY